MHHATGLRRIERAHGTAAVARSKQSLLHEALIRATSEIVWHQDVDLGQADRRGWTDFTGVSLDSADPMAWLASVHPDDQDVARRTIDEAVASGSPYTVEYRLRHHSGEWRWVEDHAIPILDADGRTTDWIGILTDIHARRTAEVDLRSSELRLRMAIEATSLGIWDVDLVAGTRDWSPELKAMLGLPPDAVASEALLIECVHPEDRERVREANRTTFLRVEGTPNNATFRVIRPDTGEVRWIRSQGRVLTDEMGVPVRRIGTFQDITDQQETRNALKLALRRQEALIAATSEIVWQASANQTEGGGTGWTEFTGQDLDAAEGDGWLESVHPDDRASAKDTCERALAAGAPYTNEYRLWHHSGDWRWVLDRVVPLFDDAGQVTEWVGIISDIHDRKTAEAEIRRAAQTDALTGLANRAMFQTRLDAALEQAGGERGGVALLLIDLDRFKEVNDSLGHDAGDEVLRVVAGRLLVAVPPGSTVARLGGDEFGVILAGHREDAVQAVAEAILRDLKQPFLYAGRELDCRATVGYAMFPDHDDDRQALLKNADMALYAAKSAGRGRASPFHKALRAEFDRRLQVLRNAKEALADEAMMPFYQPKVSLRDGRVVGFEALMRWWDGRRLQQPGALAEAFGDPELAARIGRRMLDRVLADMALWSGSGTPFGHVALNVAAPEFIQPHFARGIVERLEGARLPAGCLEVEVTESVLMENGSDTVAKALRLLDDAGIAIALDDFGTGYASLTHLKKFPVSWLKIDRSFISNMEADKDSTAIVLAVLGMAQNIGIGVVAEGVETDWQYGFLQRNGCDVAQGFLLAKPMAASRVPKFLKTWRPRQDRAAPATLRAGAG